jgi:hypothetical protein
VKLDEIAWLRLPRLNSRRTNGAANGGDNYVLDTDAFSAGEIDVGSGSTTNAANPGGGPR